MSGGARELAPGPSGVTSGAPKLGSFFEAAIGVFRPGFDEQIGIIASNPSIPREVLEYIDIAASEMSEEDVDEFYQGWSEVSDALAVNKGTPIEVLEESAYTSAVARNIAIPLEWMETFASNGTHAVAMNPMLPPHLDEHYSLVGDESIRSAVAGEIWLSADVLARLAHDEDEHVRMRVASNPSTPPDLLRGMAQSSVSERKGVARNPEARLNFSAN